MKPNMDWAKRAVSAEDAVGLIQSRMNVFVHGAAATPTPLLKALVRRKDLEGVRLYHLHTAGETPFAEPDCEGRFLSISLFTGPALRKPIEEGRADFMPIFLSDIPGLFLSRRIDLDAAHAREHGSAVRADHRLRSHGSSPDRTARGAGDGGGSAHRRDHRGIGRGRVDVADGDRGDTGRGASAFTREAGPGNPLRNVFGPRG